MLYIHLDSLWCGWNFKKSDFDYADKYNTLYNGREIEKDKIIGVL